MGAVGGTALRLAGTTIYILALGCGIVILAIYSYFLAQFSTRDVRGPTWVRAVEGISGAAVLYTLLASVLTCFLGGIMLFAFLGVALNLLFVGGFIAIAIMTRRGARSCRGYVLTPLGNGPSQSRIGWQGAQFGVRLRTACLANKAVFAVALIGIFLFLLAAIVQFLIGRHHQREKRYGTTPVQARTKGNGIRFFKRRGAKPVDTYVAHDTETGVVTEKPIAHNGVHQNGVVAPPVYSTPAMNAHQGTKHQYPQTNGTAAGTGGYHTSPLGAAVAPYPQDNRPVHNF